MDKQVKILLGDKKNIDSTNTDLHDNISLTNEISEIVEYDVHKTISSSEQYIKERENSDNYRFYGKFEWISLLNNLKFGYNELKDFFKPSENNSKNILNSFDFYLVKPELNLDEVEEQPKLLIDENFDDWVISEPTDYPRGWDVIVKGDSYMSQTLANQAELIVHPSGMLQNGTIQMTKNIIESYGTLVFKTKTTVYGNVENDSFRVLLKFDDDNYKDFNVSLTEDGEKTYTCDIDNENPIRKIVIIVKGNSLKVYLDYIKIELYNDSQNIKRKFKVLATPNDFTIHNAGFSKNVYNKQIYYWDIDKTIKLSDFAKDDEYPITELYLYAKYIESNNGNNDSELLKFCTWMYDEEDDEYEMKILNSKLLSIGDYVTNNENEYISDIVKYDKKNYNQELLLEQKFNIYTFHYNEDNLKIRLVWKYNPFIPIRLRYLSSDVYSISSNDSIYENIEQIPKHAIDILNNNTYIWREILPEGYFEPLTNIGVDHPFLNDNHYIFTPTIFSVTPDLNDITTKNIFDELWYTKNGEITSIKPKNNLDDIGKPCL